MKIFVFSILIMIISLLPFYAFSQVSIEKYRNIEDERGFSGSIKLDLSSKSGNVDITKIYWENRNYFRFKNINTFLIIRGDYGWKDGIQFSNEALVHLRNVFLLQAKVRPEIFMQIDYNKERLLALRAVVGGGLRFTLYKNKNTSLWYGSASLLEYERLTEKASEIDEKEVKVIRWSNYLSMNKSFGDNIFLTWTFVFQPCFNNFRDIRILNETDFTIKIIKNLSFTLGFRMRYDTLPPHEIKKLDTVLITGVVINY